MKTSGKEIFAKYTDSATFARIKDFASVTEMWHSAAAEYGDMPAITDNGVTYSYKELDFDASLYRSVLAKNGVTHGDRVLLFAANSYEFVKAYLAIVTLGACAVILPAHLDEMSVFGCTMKFSAKTVVCQLALEEKTALAKSKGITVISTDEKGEEAYPAFNASPEDECVIMFTGGTTGKSKGALLSHRAVMQGTVNGCYGYEHVFSQRYLLILPLSHVFGLIRNLMTSLYTGSTLFICRNNKDMFRDIALFRPTILVMVPALAEMALNLSKKFGRNMLGEDLEYVICGAAAVSPYLVNAYAQFNVRLFPGYGLTESANLVSGNPESDKKPESVGIMYPNQEYRIENGELWLKGDNMMNGYVGEPEQNVYEDGWFKTGDLVRVDGEGFLYITGRIKEVIVLPSGENVSPAEVESRFNELPLVQDSQVFEDVTESGAHILALEVVPRMTELAKLETEDSVKFLVSELEKINSTLPAFERVSRITVRDTDFERTPSMKIVRYKKCN